MLRDQSRIADIQLNEAFLRREKIDGFLKPPDSCESTFQLFMIRQFHSIGIACMPLSNTVRAGEGHQVIATSKTYFPSFAIRDFLVNKNTLGSAEIFMRWDTSGPQVTVWNERSEDENSNDKPGSWLYKKTFFLFVRFIESLELNGEHSPPLD